MKTDYHLPLAAAFVRARLGDQNLDDEEAVALGMSQGLPLHRFKRSNMPRVARVLGILRGLAPTSLLDVGCGRGAFLWPLLDAFPDLPVTTIDVSLHRLHVVAAVRAGGVDTIRPVGQSALGLGFVSKAFDTVTVLEVLEHLPSPATAARELLRVARRFVVASVPSKPDGNPEHIWFFQPEDLRALFFDAGARDVRVDHVLNHRIVVVKV